MSYGIVANHAWLATHVDVPNDIVLANDHVPWIDADGQAGRDAATDGTSTLPVGNRCGSASVVHVWRLVSLWPTHEHL